MEGRADNIRIVAIDWSGAMDRGSQRRGIWIADLNGSDCVLSGGRTRDEVCAWLIEQKRTTERMLVGIDFAFSYPEWFVREYAEDVSGFWRAIASGKAEAWIEECCEPFWGRAGNPRPPRSAWILERGLRRTDKEVRVSGAHPKSAFQIFFPGAVGTGSLRGIPCLLALQAAGFAIWPFDSAGDHTVVEIYPRLYTGRTRTSLREARVAHLAGPGFAHLRLEVRGAAAESPDAFDALVTAVGMARDLPAWDRVAQSSATEMLEGKIWNPRRHFVSISDA